MTEVVAASRSLRNASVDTMVVIESTGGPRFPNGVVADQPVVAPVVAQRWWDPRCHVRSLDPRRVAAFVASTDPISLPDEPADLIGWGPGLTPAGDDVVVGMLIGHHTMGRSRRAAELAAATATAETVALSRSLLDHAAAGETVRPVLDLITALAGRGSLDHALTALHTFGATSGAHLIDGIRRAVSSPSPNSERRACAVDTTLRNWEGVGA